MTSKVLTTLPAYHIRMAAHQFPATGLLFPDIGKPSFHYFAGLWRITGRHHYFMAHGKSKILELESRVTTSAVQKFITLHT